MIDEGDDTPEDDWPNDDEANDVMLAYEATDDLRDSRSGCAGVVVALTFIAFALVWTLAR